MNEITSLAELKKKFKNRLQTGEICFIRIPFPEKETAKEQGAKWDTTAGMHFYRSDKPDEHPLYDLRISSDAWMMLAGKIPFDLADEFKKYGVINEKDSDGKWQSWVLGVERYAELVATLHEIELL